MEYKRLILDEVEKSILADKMLDLFDDILDIMRQLQPEDLSIHEKAVMMEYLDLAKNQVRRLEGEL